jgi:hypothetical protein
MPYKVERRGEKWAVVNPETGKVYGEHPSEKQADAQLRVLYANAPENTARHQRGHLGETIAREGDKVRAPMLVTDGSLVKAVLEGKQQLSCGYTCDLEEAPGDWQGQRYEGSSEHPREPRRRRGPGAGRPQGPGETGHRRRRFTWDS